MMTIKQGVEAGVGITLGQHCTTQISRGPTDAMYVILNFLISHIKESKEKLK